MNENKNKKILIACYRNPYNPKSLEKIRNLLKEKKPEKIIVLSISETKKSSGTISSYLGRRDIEKLRDNYSEDQKIRSSSYSDRIIEISDELQIPSKKITKKGKASKIILKAVAEYKPSHVIIHPSNKSIIDKIISGSVEDKVCDKSNCEVTTLN